MVDIIQLNMGKKKKKQPKHVTFNRKVFIAQNSINSMSAIHTKIYEDGTAIIRLSDCHGSIRWHNNMNNQSEVKEMLEKLDSAAEAIKIFREQIKIKDHSAL